MLGGNVCQDVLKRILAVVLWIIQQLLKIAPDSTLPDRPVLDHSVRVHGVRERTPSLAPLRPVWVYREEPIKASAR